MLLTLYVQFVLIIDFKRQYNTQVVIPPCCDEKLEPLRATGVHEQQ